MELALSGDSDILWQDHPDPVTTDFEVLTRVLEDKPDFFIYMGDTIYSDSETEAPPALTLQDKWAKYEANRIDVTQELLAAVSTWAVWDDHEVINDFEGAQLAVDDPALLQAGVDAFNDYWPVNEAKYYRKVDYGKKIDLIFLDERSYRTQNPQRSGGPCVDEDGDADLAPTMPEDDRADLGLGPVDPDCLADVFDPTRTMLGAEQKAWLEKKLKNSTAKWKLIVNEVPIVEIFALPYDRWEGYHAERDELLQFIADKNIKNVVFLTTDHHMHAGGRVYVDITQEGAEPVAYEMVTGPIQTRTINQQVEDILGIPNGGNILKNFLIDHGLVDLDCVQVEEYGYGVVQTLDPSAADLKLQWKSHTPGTKGGGPVDDCPTVKLPKAFTPPD
jgi:alkaline phosphatase D